MMSGSLARLALLLLALAFLQEAAASAQEVRTYTNARAAFAAVLKEKPFVLGVGEYHQIHETQNVPSAIKRFTRELLPLLRKRSQALVLETWVTEGKCGKEETVATADIQETTERPKTIESELVTLIKKTRRLGIQPKILVLSCSDYKSILEKPTSKREQEAVDYSALLTLITTKLKKEIESTWLMQRMFGEIGIQRPFLVVYGGALHNDMLPKKEHKSFSYPPMLRPELRKEFFELDLVVPELVRNLTSVVSQPWFQEVQSKQNGKRTFLVKHSEHNYTLVFASKNIRP